MKAFDKISDALVQAGYSVLKYDYYGHGYSKYGGEEVIFSYDLDMFTDQLEDLLSFVEKEDGKETYAIVGHSTGGLLCVAANQRWSKDGAMRGIAPKLVLVSPAFYAKKVIFLFLFFFISMNESTSFDVHLFHFTDSFIPSCVKAFHCPGGG